MAILAYLSSVNATSVLVKSLVPDSIKEDQNPFYDQGCQEWKELLNTETLPTNPSFQSEWDSPVYHSRHSKLIETAPSESEKARLLAVSSENSSDFLYALPVSSLGLKLSDSNLRIACALRLGSPICQQHKCPCGVMVDPLGRHGLACK